MTHWNGKRRLGCIIGAVVIGGIGIAGFIGARVPPEIDPSHVPDGVYTGTSFKCPARLTLTVRIEAGRLTTVDIGRQISADRYRDACRTLASNIIDRQSVTIDDITGATVSSRAVKRAVADALDKAAKLPTVN